MKTSILGASELGIEIKRQEAGGGKGIHGMSTWERLHSVGNIIVLCECSLLMEWYVAYTDVDEDRKRHRASLRNSETLSHVIEALCIGLAIGNEVRPQFSNNQLDD